MSQKLVKAHSLGDFLNDTFSLVPRIWKQALPASSVAILPGVALWMMSIGSIAAWVRRMGAAANADPLRTLSGLTPALLLIGLATLLLFLGASLQKAFILSQAGAAIEGRSPSLRENLATALRPAWLRVAVQDAVVGSLAGAIILAALGIALFPFLLGVLGDVARFKHSSGTAFRFVLEFIALYLGSMLVALAVVWWLRVKTSVSGPATVLERANSFAGIGRSLELVRGRGWRIFGVMFIVSLVISFGLGILTGPFAFAVGMPGYFSFLRSSTSGAHPSPEAVAQLLSSMTWRMGLVMFLSGIVKGGLWPSFLALLYTDLRVRRGEIEAQAEEEPLASDATRG